MKTIGLLGGMSWESTQGYYRAINEGVKEALGGLHSAKLVLNSVDFAEIEACQQSGDWRKAGEILAQAAQGVEAAGADCLLICTNTMHKVAEDIDDAISIPLIHIADATGEALKQAGVKRVGLLGTAFTMEQDFYKGRLSEQHDLEVLIPKAEDRALIHRVIFQELCVGITTNASKAEYLRIIEALKEQGAEAVILGCTEIGMLVTQADTDTPLFDTTEIHAGAAVTFALK
ncbi:aspartate/glutamate racemase family protein [Marinomonas communis]|uniref:aspartate/glutamate racemase family protein n=1 Tax=Marinomonas communis TaxID=28254 RepID=UPI0010016765|nr:aspartate/glutamate racemase family protein [Marinomonas communis]MCC4273206.1 aspartate/glutamate racemase family protein [Marinomonas communis]RUM56958.1 MAG: aspartate racemase [Marinomonas sp.]